LEWAYPGQVAYCKELISKIEKNGTIHSYSKLNMIYVF
jgi:hypothetical protein